MTEEALPFIMKATYGPLWYKLFKCMGCKFWIGKCTKGKIGKVASTVACDSFKPR